jgi:CubicO group peptidase (beta-lactamase class C family)
MNTALRATIAIVVLSGAVVLSSGVAAAAQSPVRTDSSSDIDAWVEQRMAARGLPGTAVAVVRGGEVVHLAGYGVADDTGRMVTPDTPFILGSASKPFTGVVIGQLVEEGLLSWDEPVWPHLSHLVDEPPDGFETATVEQLLTHTAGLGMIVGTAGTVTIHEGPDALDRRVDELLSRRLAAAPGEGFNYSNAGFMLLAAVTEQVTGRPFADELGDRVFDPLGMTGSFATADDPRAADMATGHQQWFGRWRPVELAYDDAGTAMGYIASTASDLATFMQAHLDGHPAIPASAADIITGTVVPTGWDTPLDAGYGHGWFIDERAGTPVASHPGSLGHFTAHILLAPDADGLGIAVVSNASAFLAGHEAQYDIGLGLLDLLLDQQPQPSTPSALMVLVVPVLAWLVVAALLAALARDLARLRVHGLPAQRRRGARGWVRALLPGAVLIASGGGLLIAAPLGLARHFYPDGGWAVTAGAWIALTWGLVRVVTAVASSARARRLQPPAATPGVRKSEAIWEP